MFSHAIHRLLVRVSCRVRVSEEASVSASHPPEITLCYGNMNSQVGDVKRKIYTHCGTNPGMQKLSLKSGGQTVSCRCVFEVVKWPSCCVCNIVVCG